MMEATTDGNTCGNADDLILSILNNAIKSKFVRESSTLPPIEEQTYRYSATNGFDLKQDEMETCSTATASECGVDRAETDRPDFDNDSRSSDLAAQDTESGEECGADNIDAGKSSLIGSRPHQPVGKCKVCGDVANGMYFGALVCVPCKTFFLRYAGDDFAYECKSSKDCQITTATRTHCKHCRYRRCLQAGMRRKVRPMQVPAIEGQQLCVVCQDIGNGIHFGAVTCEGCKKFFRRGLTEHPQYLCKKGGRNCSINPRTRNLCRYCRFQKCLSSGMSREAIQMGRPSRTGPPERHSSRDENDENRGQRITTQPNSQATDNSTTCLTTDNRPLLNLYATQQSSSATNAPSVDGIRFGLGSADDSGRYFLVMFPALAPVGPASGIILSEQPVDLSHRGAITPASNSCGGFPSLVNLTRSSSCDLGTAETSDFTCPVVKKEKTDNFGSNVLELESRRTFSTSDCENDADAGNRDSVGREHKSDSRCEQAVEVDIVSTAHESLSSLSTSTDNSESVRCKIERRRPSADSDQIAYSTVPPRKRWRCVERALSETNAVNDSNANSSTTKEVTVTEKSCSAKDNSNCICASAVVENLINATMHPQNECTNGVGRRLNLCTSIGCMSYRAGVDGEMNGNKGDKESLLNSGPLGSPTVSSSGFPILDVTAFSSGEDFLFPVCPDENSGDDAEDEEFLKTKRYWLRPCLPDKNVVFAATHWEIINTIVPAYNKFVSLGTTINKSLRKEFDKWWKTTGDSENTALLSKWIQSRVIPAYTVLSVAYCKSLPEFSTFDHTDQMTIIRLGQSPSRILVAALHWFDADNGNFRNFLSWREMKPGHVDLFKEKLRRYADDITRLQLDPVEAALLNALIIIASDYPDIKAAFVIENAREKILSTFQAYITAKLGAPNSRLEQLFRSVPSVRQLGLLHHHMTETKNMTVEELGK